MADQFPTSSLPDSLTKMLDHLIDTIKDPKKLKGEGGFDPTILSEILAEIKK